MPVVEKMDRHGCQYLDIDSILFGQNRMVFIDDVITDGMASDIIKQLIYLASVSSEDIIMVINSPGGSVTAGMAIFDAMCGIPCDVSTICIGFAASMAAFLLAAGAKGKRYITPNSETMIHQVMGGVQGQVVDVQIAANRIVREKDTINNYLAGFTGQPIEKIQIDTDRDYFMTANESCAYGMVDGIQNTVLGKYY